MAIAGDAATTDPACVKSPIHARMATLIDAALAKAGPAEAKEAAESFVYRRIGAATRPAEPIIVGASDLSENRFPLFGPMR